MEFIFNGFFISAFNTYNLTFSENLFNDSPFLTIHLYFELLFNCLNRTRIYAIVLLLRWLNILEIHYKRDIPSAYLSMYGVVLWVVIEVALIQIQLLFSDVGFLSLLGFVVRKCTTLP